MAYGVKYIVEFSTLTLKISQKDYVGDTTGIEAGSPAVLHKWDEDNPMPPIKGSSLTVTVTDVPLLDFYANNDDEFKCDLFKEDNTLLFSGFLVQDDCMEDVDDLTHPVTLSFTDNLGLLKDATFDGEVFTTSKLTLFNVITYCIQQTGINLPLNIFSKLKEDSQSAGLSFLQQTLIAKESFLKSEREYDNCYSVLETILKDLGATIIQANGQWNIIRFLEGQVTGFTYDDTYAFIGAVNYPAPVQFGLNLPLYPEAGYHKKIQRPYRVVKETFNYKLPFQILKNADLKELGSLRNTYSDVANIVKEYDFPKWFDSTLAPQASTYFIRVVTDPLGNELERYVVVKGDAIMSTAIEGDTGDAIKFAFNIRTRPGAPLPANLVFVIQLTNGTTIRYADEDGKTWKSTTGYSKPFTTDLSQWQNVEITTGRLPFSGLVRVFLTLATPSASDETHYNDLRFTYTAYINESTKITGHTHTTTQDLNTKNKSEEDIDIDDSPRNFVSGTLFLNVLNGSIQARTTKWNLGKRLGQIVVGEQKQWRSRPRTILEGNLYGDVYVSPLNTFKNPAFPELNFVPGNMEIDYAGEKCSGTMYELYDTAEPLITSEYKFDYIYDTK
jgi:hypothetical protein